VQKLRRAIVRLSILQIAVQTEKAYQKQPIFRSSKATVDVKTKKGTKRWYKDVGLGFKTPEAAISGHYIGSLWKTLSVHSHMTDPKCLDKKCPFTSDVSIRGRILTGKVISTKMTRTIVIRREYLHFVKSECKKRGFSFRKKSYKILQFLEYARYEKRHKNMAVHCSPAFRVEIGDTVTIGQCRPLSKVRSDFPSLNFHSSHDHIYL
jgi:small subunit ribosomal protein S11e